MKIHEHPWKRSVGTAGMFSLRSLANFTWKVLGLDKVAEEFRKNGLLYPFD